MNKKLILIVISILLLWLISSYAMLSCKDNRNG